MNIRNINAIGHQQTTSQGRNSGNFLSGSQSGHDATQQGFASPFSPSPSSPSRQNSERGGRTKSRSDTNGTMSTDSLTMGKRSSASSVFKAMFKKNSASWSDTLSKVSPLRAELHQLMAHRRTSLDSETMSRKVRSIAVNKKSQFAIECGMRAQISLADTQRLMSRKAMEKCGQVKGVKQPWLPPPRGSGLKAFPTFVSRQFESTVAERLLEVLAVGSLAYAPFQLAIEPSCGHSMERVGMEILKITHLILSIVYSTVSFGEMSALKLQPLRSFAVVSGRCIASIWRRRKPDYWEKRFEEEHAGDQQRLDVHLLDYFVLVGVVAEMVHLKQTPDRLPTSSQCLIMVEVLKCWRWIKPPRQHKSSVLMSEFWFQVIYLFITMFLFTHVCSCIFALVATIEANNGWATWADEDLTPDRRSCNGLYWSMFYFSAYTVTSIGHGDIVPLNKQERAVNAVIMILSQMYVAKIFADLTFLISTRNYWRAQRQHRVTQTSAALHSMRAPAALRKRVLAYQDFIWEVRTERRAQECLYDLSDVLRFELRAVMYHELVLQAPFLSLLSIAALRHIVKHLSDISHLPSDFIVRRGDEGSDVFFIREGAAGIFVSKHPPQWHDNEVKIVNTGDYFGEVGMLTAQKRTAWVMARTFVVCSVLPKKAVDDVVAADPSCMVPLAKSMQKALNLSPALKWPEVTKRLNSRFGDFIGVVEHMLQIDPEVPPGDVTWRRYEKLMTTLKVSVLDQKLLWVDVDIEEKGWVSLKDFARVAFGDAFDPEFFAQLEEDEEFLVCSSTSITSVLKDRRASLTAAPTAHQAPQRSSSRIPSKTSNFSSCQLSSTLRQEVRDEAAKTLRHLKQARTMPSQMNGCQSLLVSIPGSRLEEETSGEEETSEVPLSSPSCTTTKGDGYEVMHTASSAHTASESTLGYVSGADDQTTTTGMEIQQSMS